MDKNNSFASYKGFEEIYNRYASQMLIICHNKIGDKEVAKEIVQNIFKSLWERRNNLVIHTNLKYYLMKAVKFEIIDYLRKQARQTIPLRLNENESSILVSNNFVEHELQYAELKQQVEKLVKRLPNKCREVYSLSRNSQMTNKEIAQKLSISTKTVEAHMTKALRFLETSMKEGHMI